MKFKDSSNTYEVKVS